MLMDAYKAAQDRQRVGLADASTTGIQPVNIHCDLEILESNRLHGNTDPRYSDVLDVIRNRLTLIGGTACESTVVMVPQPSDKFWDVDKRIVAPKEGYKNWPEELRPTENVVYDPVDPPQMLDLPFDGLITARPRKGLMLNAADCAPLVMYDVQQKVLALAHVGREGADQDIATKILMHMERNNDVKAKNVVAYFGPAVAQKSYVLTYLGESLRREAWRPFVNEVNGGFATDIVGYAMQRLIENGINADNITRSSVDTATDPDYFSLTAHNSQNRPIGRNGFVVARA